MVTFSADPASAEREMRAVIYYLTSFGFIDGEFDAAERRFVGGFVRKLIEARADEARGLDPEAREAVVTRWTKHFNEVIEDVAHEIEGHFSESVSEGESSKQFVLAKIKLRCFELFKRFDEESRHRLLDTADALIQADGVEHPDEITLRDEVRALLDAPVELDMEDVEEHIEHGGVRIAKPRRLPPVANDHAFLRSGEWNYDPDPEVFAGQAKKDVFLAEKVIARLDAMRAKGAGKLATAKLFTDFVGQEPFLDGNVHVLQPKAGEHYELLVIGDLHGCYSCLKAALLQTDFLGKVERHHMDPANNPATKLVLLGDYIDRGRFSYNGILRAVMQLFLVAPDDVYVLRGNHEYYIEHNGKVLAPVRPAEAMTSLQNASTEVVATFMRLFEALPHVLAFDRTFFVHAGIPRDDTQAEHWKGLESLNQADIRFQMLWSDPSEADVVPAELQKQTARFPFGKKQFQAFMSRMGMHTMVRGHTRVIEGFREVYDSPDARLLSLFSAGGKTNADLPETSNYREVTPMALTLNHRDGVSEITPFVIEYERYNQPEHNNFFQQLVQP